MKKGVVVKLPMTHQGNPSSYIVHVHPDVEQDLRDQGLLLVLNPDKYLRDRQEEIRALVRQGGHTPELQMQCAVIGHRESSITGARCFFCLADLRGHKA